MSMSSWMGYMGRFLFYPGWFAESHFCLLILNYSKNYVKKIPSKSPSFLMGWII